MLKTAASAAQHWIVDVARRAAVPLSDTLDIAAGKPLSEAWGELRRVCHLSDDAVTTAIAAHFRLPVADLSSVSLQALKLLPESVARKYVALPIAQDDRTLTLATANPVDLGAEQAIAFASGRRPVFVMASPTAILQRLAQHYAPERVVESLLAAVDDRADDVKVIEEMAPENIPVGEMDTAPVVKLTNLMLRGAVDERASDVHIEPTPSGGVVRFRVDGVLRTHMQLPLAALTRVVSRIKILGKLDIADRLRPQDGRARIQVHGRNYDVRISTVPTRDVEKVVMRLLEPDRSVGLDELGTPAQELARMRKLMAFREGIVVVTGPTGSGKTTTMYSAIRELASGKINITTVEDPVEYEMANITQIQVDPKRGVTFPSALRAVLRQDPDVVFVGEIRDMETAEVAVQASVTGHLVLATLHTNDAAGVVQRLLDIGLNRASLAGALRGIVAQRLVRVLCQDCARPVNGALTDEETRLAERYHVTPIMRAVGCDQCRDSGYRGRAAISEVLTTTPEFIELVAKGGSASELQAAAVAGGMRPMRVVSLDLVRSGRTTLEELERVLGEAMSPSAGAPAVVEAEATNLPQVLLVDDDPVVRTMARATLEKNGFGVTEVGDGASALERLAGDRDFALMVLDLKMPGIHGLEMIQRVRSSVRTAGLPIIVVTGSEDAASEVGAMEAGADDYIRKPLDPPRFLARVKGALRRATG